jgi:serine beta-lactamase-like protein LACTB, mitochondrial
MNLKPTCVLLAILATSSVTHAQPSDLSAKVRARINQDIEAQKIVGLCAGIGFNGNIIAAESFGFEDREAKTAASEQTMFRWASVSKPLTAVVTMQLAKEGKLDLDADLRTLVPEFPKKPWPVTSRQLLCHQGGIVHYINGKVIKTERTYDSPHPFKDTILALDNFKESPLLSEPGTTYSYTTHGYMLVGAVAERAGKQPFAELVKVRIATPCGMTTLRPDYQWEDIPHSAIGYRKIGGAGNVEGEIVKSGDTDVSWKLPGGGFISTATDMARFGLGMVTGKLVDDATREQMWTRQKTRDGKETDYGLGFRVAELDGTRLIEHSGSQEKTITHLLILPDRGVVIALMANTEGTRLGALARDLAKLVTEPAH